MNSKGYVKIDILPEAMVIIPEWIPGETAEDFAKRIFVIRKADVTSETR